MAAEIAVQAIHTATEFGRTATVARMLDEDPRLLTTVWADLPLLVRPAQRGNVGMVRLLLERGADVNTSNAILGTALHCAAREGHEELVSILLSSGADVYRRDASGGAALKCACQRGHVAVVRLLLRSMRGRGVNARDRYGRTALWCACSSGRAEVVRALLLAGADHTIANNDGITPQQAAQERPRSECAALIQWWEGELARAYVLHKARTLHDDTATHQQAPVARVPAYLRPRVQAGSLMPSVEVVTVKQGGEEKGEEETGVEEGQEKQEEEVGAMVGFVVKDLAAELYTELLAGLYQ